ncbi:MAG TPA: hypothetical protein DCX06_01285 [Opitutae bacterium]|nr:hypothetical protein [Opitutae bacterium]
MQYLPTIRLSSDSTLSMNTRQILHSKAQKAFTLIEIMVATVIMVILVGLVIQITSEVLKVWNKSSGKLSANAEARIAMDLITQDLETAVFRNNGLQWLRAEDDSFSIPGASGTTTATVALRLFSPALDRPSGPGDICAIAYKLDYLNPVTGATVGDRLFVLYRLVVDPKSTFDDLMGDPIQQTLPVKGATVWAGGSTSESIIGTSPNGGNYLVSNVAGFEINFHVEDDGDPTTTTEVPGDTIFGGTDSTVGSGAASPAAPRFAKPLAYAEVKLTVISDEGTQKIQNLANVPESLDDIIREHGEVFTRRVNFLARPL